MQIERNNATTEEQAGEARKARSSQMQRKAQEPWRRLLAGVLSNGNERVRIANELGVSPATLVRWGDGKHDPKPQDLLELRQVLPEERRDEFASLLEQMPSMQEYAFLNRKTVLPTIPPFVLMRIIETRASASSTERRFFDVATVLLQQALSQIDPGKLGMSISIARCMPPHNGVIRSLRESVGIGSPPWPKPVTPRYLLLGAESLAGHVVATTLFQVVDAIDDPQCPVPYRHEKDGLEKSVAVFPIRGEGDRVAGCLIASSVQADYFQENHVELLAAYTTCCSLAFESQDFYDPRQILLRELPSMEIQQTYRRNLRKWIAEAIHAAEEKGAEPITAALAERMAWQRLEDALLGEGEENGQQTLSGDRVPSSIET